MSLRAAISERRSTLWFVARFLVIFAALRAAYPLLAPGYKAAFGGAANAFLWAAEPGGTVQLRFEPWAVVDGPDRERMAVLRARDRVFGQEARMRVDVRSFSYRPLATFVALLLAFRWRSRRRAAVVASAGLATMTLLTGFLAAVGALRFGLGAVLGFGRGPLIQTIYEAMTTPAMLYALPIVVFWALVRLTDRASGVALAA
ncbi:MAG TPA: hypothetical protein VHO67_02945 [Polyangia bacterium]|nr:hypothetical protein [Polyangia bacterium]